MRAAFAMTRPLLFLLLLLLSMALPARAQLGSFGDVPVDINAESSDFESGLAVARGNVLIRYGEVAIYSDYAQYNPDTRDILVIGNVRIYREQRIFAGERAIYNLETKKLTAADFRGSTYPFGFSADTLTSLGSNAYQAEGVTFTTSDSSKPDYTLRAHGARIYPGDRIILRDVFLYVGQTPILWFPYVYQSLNKEQGFSFVPGYTSTLGAYLFTRYTFPIGEDLSATLRFDLMSKRGVGYGIDSKWGGAGDGQRLGPLFRLLSLRPLHADQ